MTWLSTNCQKVYSGYDLFEIIRSIGLEGKILVLAAPFMEQIDLLKGISDVLKDCSVSMHIDDIVNPDIDQIQALATEYSEIELNAIIAIGGGSILDTAKVLSVVLANPAQDAMARLKKGQMPEFYCGVPVIAIPTTSGTGAESTQFATVWDLHNGGKYSLESEFMLPQYVILVASLTLGLPYEQTLFTGLDALSHATESLWNKKYNPLARAYAKEAISIMSRSFLPALNDLQNVEHRQKMQEASHLAGRAISITKTAIAHAISYPLTYKYSVPHGLASSFSIPALFEYVSGKRMLPEDVQEDIQKSTDLIAALEPIKYLSKYVTCAELLALIPEMNNPQRFGNYIAPVTTMDLENIISAALRRM